MITKYKGYFLVLGTAFISGFSIFINKFGVSAINPYIFTFLKNAIVALLLCAIIFSAKNFSLLKSIKKKQWGLLALIGIIGGGIPFLLFFKGLSLTSAAGASFVHKTMFIWIFILAALFLKEKIKKEYILAGALLLAGNLLLLKISSVSFDTGSFLVFLATLFWAVESVVSKHILKEIPPRVVMWARMFFGSLVILFFLIFTGQAALLAKLNLQQISWAMITGAVLLGYVATWYSGLKYIKVSEAAVILALGSPITTLLTAVFSNPVGLKEYFSSVLIFLGVIAIFGIRNIYKTIGKLKFSTR
ncbi:MAG: hypothetical protein A3J63_04975 [Candidatus Moranbacteria bacterium RIFCSPHIGHO2_02_FULL_40_12b]|nr:MAG: hypothetical protein A3J63_04975 [Candidatus Moranbacteria bacterium RIFCSPHIGHO2_02_FULL_40_12b]OGI23735.1 MAG: hypothetical protein A3E91_02075 [Candidatus Moranbacteria bacterium RIFCSPHIGHO2_12_FULL_40_10]